MSNGNADEVTKNCLSCEHWLNGDNNISHSICMKVEFVDEDTANILLREKDDSDDIEQSDIDEVGVGPPVITFTTLDTISLKYVSVATHWDFSCSLWEAR